MKYQAKKPQPYLMVMYLSVKNDSRYGWDKPDYERLRLTIMHSPQNFDRGNYSLRYGIFGHAQDWRNGSIAASARFNQPLIAHVTEKHTGTAGRELSMVTASSGIAVMALKKAEKSDKYVIRVRELEGKICNNAELVFSAPVTFAEELDGYEDVKGAVSVSGSRIRFNINAYSPKTFSFRLGNNKPQIPLRSDIFSFWVSPFDTLVTDAPVMQLRNTGSNPPTSIRPSSGAAWLTLSVSGIGWNQSISHNVISSKMEKSICTTIVQVQSDNFSDGYYTVIAKKGSSVPVSLRFVPDWAVVLPNKQTKLNVEAYDKNGDVIDWPIVWSCDTKGSVDTNGEYYSGSDTGWSIVSAAAQGIVNITAQSQIRIDSLMPGLKYDFYKNYSAKTVDSIEYKSVDSTKTTYGFFFNYGNLDSFAIKYTGVIFIEKAGDYTFYVKADNGAVLYIDGNKIVDRDGVGNFWTEKSGLANLTRGLHTIKVLYLKNTYYYAGELSVAWSSVPLSIPKQTIPGNLFYHRKYSGEHVYVENQEIKHLAPKCYALFPVVPNPMKLTSLIMFDVPSVNNNEYKANIAIRLYDIRGRLVRTILNEKVQGGHHVINFNGLSDEGRKLVSGIYFVKMNIPTKTMHKKMIIAR
ncbi:MAG: T9SS type A sorting domain-containing protein [Fibrobacteres bacterium]|nr:T9SS type A sorting domain-containing protein [Fibrobacterota bacterium]